MNRSFWFVAGAGAGVYTMVKARRAVEAFTPEGLRDRLSGLTVGARLFADEVRAGQAEKETELRERLGLTLDGPRELRPRSTTAPPAPAPPIDAAPADAAPTDAAPTAAAPTEREDR